MRELTITKNDANQRVDKFITKTFKHMPKSLMYKYIRNKKIKVNRARCEISQRLMEGDTVQCYIREEFFEQNISYDFLKVSAELQIIYEDDNILAINKPIGLLAHKDEAGIQDNLADRMLHYLYQQGCYDPSQTQSFTPALAHRIDRNTQGIVLAAKNAEALRELNEKIRNREIAKYYLCIIEGHMDQAQGDILLYHKKDEQENRAMLSQKPVEGYQEIRSSYKVLEVGKHHSLLEIQLHTGKSHQIRASLAFLHHPLLGDRKYGAKAVSNFPYQALCAYRVRFANTSKSGCLDTIKDKEILLKDIQLLAYFKKYCVC